MKCMEMLAKYEDRETPMSVEKSNCKYKAVDIETGKIYHYNASRCPKCENWMVCNVY